MKWTFLFQLANNKLNSVIFFIILKNKQNLQDVQKFRHQLFNIISDNHELINLQLSHHRLK